MKRIILMLLLSGSIATTQAMMINIPPVVIPTINELIPKSFYMRALGFSSCLSGIYLITSQLNQQKRTLESQDIARYIGGTTLLTAGALTLIYGK